MSWVKIDRVEDFIEKLTALVKPQEISCIDTVPMISGTRKSSKPIIAHTYGDTLDAALFFTDYGRVMPVMGNQFFFRQEDVNYVSALAGNTVFLPTSVSGKTEAVDMFLDKFSCGQRQQVVEHYIMELEPDRFKMPQMTPPQKMRILKGSTRQLLPLFPLQKTYERQEVLLNPDSQDTMETFRWLRSILTNEICFYARRGFRYVSKANTNARGFDHIQVGGVFTVPRFRNQGYALHTVAALCRFIIEEEHKIPSLFVRSGNKNAIKLYKSLGFEIKDTTKTVYLD
ncbi:MAG: GNAT family N-acetyltransferase [Spirochaetia bacterium]|nr:GNAT family N-acetyltransferase [Spirochaetia bacterium]